MELPVELPSPFAVFTLGVLTGGGASQRVGFESEACSKMCGVTPPVVAVRRKNKGEKAVYTWLLPLLTGAGYYVRFSCRR